jgi:hypothetical protein
MTRDPIGIDDAVDPGEPSVVGSMEEEPNEGGDFPEAEIIVDEETGKHYVAFEIDPSSFEEEGQNEGGEEK